MKFKNRKVLLIISAIILSIIIISAPVSAIECGGVETNLLECESEGIGSARTIGREIIQYLSIGVGILGVIGISIVGVQYLTARDNKEQVSKARKRLFHIILGIALYAASSALIVWLLPGGLDYNEYISAEKVVANAASLKVYLGDSTSVGFVVYPLDAENGALSYKSSDPSVATVDLRGKVITKKIGKTTITATTADGKSASTEITVEERPKEEENGSKASGKCKYNSVNAEGCTLYCQGGGESWAGRKYGRCSNATYASSACGPTSLAMIIANLTNNTSVTPTVIGDKAVSRGARICGNGTSAGSLIGVVKEYGLKYQKIAFNKNSINQALNEGKLVWLSCGGRKPCSTSGGHYIVIRGKTASGNWLLFNSAGGCSKGSYAPSKREYTPDYIIGSAYRSQNGGPYAIWK